MFCIPPVAFETPEGKRVSFNFLLPSGATMEDITVEVMPGGKVLLLTWAVPGFFLDIDRLRFETDGNVDDFHPQGVAHQEGVRELRAHANEHVLIPMEYTIPIRVEEQLTPNDIRYIAFPHPDPDNQTHFIKTQFICYLVIHLRGFNNGKTKCHS
jgi:hypothetical protein